MLASAATLLPQIQATDRWYVQGVGRLLYAAGLPGKWSSGHTYSGYKRYVTKVSDYKDKVDASPLYWEDYEEAQKRPEPDTDSGEDVSESEPSGDNVDSPPRKKPKSGPKKKATKKSPKKKAQRFDLYKFAEYASVATLMTNFSAQPKEELSKTTPT